MLKDSAGDVSLPKPRHIRGPERLTIFADPKAQGFYERNESGTNRRGTLAEECPGYLLPLSRGKARSHTMKHATRRGFRKIPARGRNSLLRAKTSLMARFASLIGRNKFPVPALRELPRKWLNLFLYCEPTAAHGCPDGQYSLYFPS